MPTIDLTPTPAEAIATTPLDAAPRRVGLTLPELQHAAAAAGGAPLPFELAPPANTAGLEDRLGRSRATTADQAYRAAVAALPEPEQSLARRGLTVDGRLDPAVAGAVGLLATPELALDVDVACRGVQAKTWHRAAAGAVASLSTVDGIVFELAWFPVAAWADELARVAAVSEEVTLGESAVPAVVDLPFELVDAAGEALANDRPDLVPVLAARHEGAVRGPDGPLAQAEVAQMLTALSGEAQGRLRAIVAEVGLMQAVGVVAWTLLADGWHALRPHREAGEQRVEIRRVDPRDLAATLAPALTEASR